MPKKPARALEISADEQKEGSSGARILRLRVADGAGHLTVIHTQVFNSGFDRSRQVAIVLSAGDLAQLRAFLNDAKAG